MTKTTDGIAFGDELYLPSLAMADQIATDDNKTVQSELNEINQNLERPLIWTNPSPKNEVSSGTTFAMDLSNYSYIEVEFYWDTSNDERTPIMKFSVDNYTHFFSLGTHTRKMIVNTSGIEFGSTSSNVMLIPYKIYGIK